MSKTRRERPAGDDVKEGYTQLNIWLVETKNWRGLAECFMGRIVKCGVPGTKGQLLASIDRRGPVHKTKLVGYSWITNKEFLKWDKRYNQ